MFMELSSMIEMKLVSRPVSASNICSRCLRSSFSSCFWKRSFLRLSLTYIWFWSLLCMPAASLKTWLAYSNWSSSAFDCELHEASLAFLADGFL